MAITFDVNDVTWQEKIGERIDEFKKDLLGQPTADIKDIQKAIKFVTQGTEFAKDKKNPKFIWISDAKFKDLEPLRVETSRYYEETEFSRQIRTSRDLLSFGPSPGRLYALDRAARSNLFSYYTARKLPSDSEVSQKMNDLLHLTDRYARRVRGLINRSQIIPDHMHKVNQAATVTNWYCHNMYARSLVVPHQVSMLIRAIIFGDHFIDSHSKTQLRDIESLKMIATNICGVIPMGNKILLIEKPTIYVDGRNFLHREDGPAIYFSKLNRGIYCLNDVAVWKKIVGVKPENLKSDLLTKTRNAEVRRELVRKIGIERILDDLNAVVLDKNDNYELVDLQIDNGRSRPYLKMLNPSTGDWHVEGVQPGTRTIEEALQYRNGTRETPVILT